MEIKGNSGTSSVYSKEVSVMMAGFAIVQMMTLHMFQDSVSGKWLSEGVAWHSILGQFAEYAMQWIRCTGAVTMFALTSGYVLYANPKAYATMKSRALRLLRFLLVYWVIELLFLGVGWLNGDVMPTCSQLLWNLIGQQTSTHAVGINVPFAWYVTYFIEFILLVPGLLWAYRGQNIVRDAVVTIVIGLLASVVALPFPDGPLKSVLSCLHPLRSTCLGIFIAKYALFDKHHQWIGRKLPLWSLLLLFVVIGVCMHLLEIMPPLWKLGWFPCIGYVIFYMQAFRMVVVLAYIIHTPAVYNKKEKVKFAR
jgi:hypothetical protein